MNAEVFRDTADYIVFGQQPHKACKYAEPFGEKLLQSASDNLLHYGFIYKNPCTL